MFAILFGKKDDIMSAAKDMFETLEYLEVTLRLWGKDDGLAYKMVKAALKKAKGEA